MPWPSSEALLSWPDLLSDPSIMGNTIQKLKRGRASRHLGLEAPLATEEDTLSLGIHQGQPRYFSASGEPPRLGAEVGQQSCCHHHWLHSGGQGRRGLVGILVWEGRNPAGHQAEVGGPTMPAEWEPGEVCSHGNDASKQHFLTGFTATVCP